MKGILNRLLPKKSRFTGIDIGTRQIKAAKIRLADGMPEVLSLTSLPTPPGVWTDSFDEEALIQSLKDISGNHPGDVITCIGGENLVSRVVRLPVMTDKETEAAVKFEVQKFVPTPIKQLIVRYVTLDANGDINDRKDGQSVLILAVPAVTVYRYYSVLSRAGLVVTSIDDKAFALWRLFCEKNRKGNIVLVDIGENTTLFVMVRDSVICFVRVLPLGAGNAPVDNRQQCSDLWEQASDLARELKRTLHYYTKESIEVERVMLSGGAANIEYFVSLLSGEMGLPIEIPSPEIKFAMSVSYDPSFAVALGLALGGMEQ